MRFKREFKRTNRDLLKIMDNMLQFNPKFRLTAEEILESKFFDPIRNEKLEIPASNKVYAPFDKEGKFDYEKCEEKNLTLDDVKELIKEESRMIKL